LLLYSFQRRGNEEGCAGLFSLVTDARIHRNGTKLNQRMSKLDIWKNFFTLRVFKHWKSLPSNLVASAYQAVFKRINSATYCQEPALQGELNLMISVSPF